MSVELAGGCLDGTTRGQAQRRDACGSNEERFANGVRLAEHPGVGPSLTLQIKEQQKK